MVFYGSDVSCYQKIIGAEFTYLYINVSSVVEFQRWWVLKSMLFAQESTCSKEIVLKQSCNELWFVKKCRNRTFNVNFLFQKLTEFFQKKII